MADGSRAVMGAVQPSSKLAQVRQGVTGQHRQPPVMLVSDVPVNDVEDDRHAPKPWTWVGVVAGIVAAGYWVIQLL